MLRKKLFLVIGFIFCYLSLLQAADVSFSVRTFNNPFDNASSDNKDLQKIYNIGWTFNGSFLKKSPRKRGFFIGWVSNIQLGANTGNRDFKGRVFYSTRFVRELLGIDENNPISENILVISDRADGTLDGFIERNVNEEIPETIALLNTDLGISFIYFITGLEVYVSTGVANSYLYYNTAAVGENPESPISLISQGINLVSNWVAYGLKVGWKSAFNFTLENKQYRSPSKDFQGKKNNFSSSELSLRFNVGF